MQGKLPKACFRTAREVDTAEVVHSRFFSKGVFRGGLNGYFAIARSIIMG